MPPDDCKMPDLKHLEPLRPEFLIGRTFVTPASKELSRYRAVFVRLVDKALNEYNQARRAEISQIALVSRSPEEISEAGILQMLSFPDHMENCINSTRRLLALLDRLKTIREARIPKTTRKWLESRGKGLTDIRDTIEHIDEKIQRDELGEQGTIAIGLEGAGDTIGIGQHQIKCSELAGILNKLHGVGLSLIEAIDINKAVSTKREDY